MSYRLKLVFFFLCSLATLFLFSTARQGEDTLARLNAVEAARDQWQRPSDVIRALDLRLGNVAVDLGCGSGYFTLKLSEPVGPGGIVLAEDIRRFPLLFLWFRKVLKNEPNVKVLLGDPSNPHLPLQTVNAVLISNTYHEFTDPQSVLTHVSQSLVSGGRLVVVDRAPQLAVADSGESAREHHEASSEQVEDEIRHAGLQIVSRQDHFIVNDPSNEEWWLITARKP